MPFDGEKEAHGHGVTCSRSQLVGGIAGLPLRGLVPGTGGLKCPLDF